LLLHCDGCHNKAAEVTRESKEVAWQPSRTIAVEQHQLKLMTAIAVFIEDVNKKRG
jgi:hypothetical protein